MEKLLLSNGERGGSENTLRGATLPKQQKQNIRIQFSGLYLASLCIHPSFLWNDQRGKILFARIDRSWGEKFAAGAQTGGAEHQTLSSFSFKHSFFSQWSRFWSDLLNRGVIKEEKKKVLLFTVTNKSWRLGSCPNKSISSCNNCPTLGTLPLSPWPLHQIMLTLATSTRASINICSNEPQIRTGSNITNGKLSTGHVTYFREEFSQIHPPRIVL